MEDKQHGLKGRPSNAAKPQDQKAESFIHARCTSSDKAGWVKAAQSNGMKLTEWIVSVLNDAAKTGQRSYGSSNTKVRLFTSDQLQQYDYVMTIESKGVILASIDGCSTDDAAKFMKENHPEITDYRVNFHPRMPKRTDKQIKKVIGFSRGVDPVGPIMELKLECGHAVEFSREWRSDDEIPDQYLCDKCLK